MATIKSWSESDWKSMINCEDEIMWNYVQGGKTAKPTYGKTLKKTMLETHPAEVKKLTKSIDNRLLPVIEKKGHYIKM